MASAFIVRVVEEIRRFNLPTQPVLPFKTMQAPTWGLELPMMDYEKYPMQHCNRYCGKRHTDSCKHKPLALEVFSR